MTADDYAAYLTRITTDPISYLYKTNLDLRKAVVTKTGPWEVTVKLPLDALLTGIFRFGDVNKIAPIEMLNSPFTDWKDVSFGTGAYMITDVVPGSTITMSKNPNYWMKNPVGPGKGDQLPYIDYVKYLIIPDQSTRQASHRTGKVDSMTYELDDAKQVRKLLPQLLESTSGEPTKPLVAPESIDFPSDQAPFSDIRVRQALFMATDLKGINDSLYEGLGVIESWPFQGVRGYEDLRVRMDDPDTPGAIKELYTYNPDKAKQLLKDAGFPNGFKTKALMTSTTVDYWAIIKDQWAKVGVTLELDVKDSAVRTNILNAGGYEGLTDGGVASDSAFHSTPTLTGTPSANANTSHIFDTKVDDWLKKVRMTILSDGMKAGMKEARGLVMYVQEKAYAVPVPYIYKYTFWWPWLKNYSGESTVGYYDGPNWVPYVWIDKNLKTSMGY